VVQSTDMHPGNEPAVRPTWNNRTVTPHFEGTSVMRKTGNRTGARRPHLRAIFTTKHGHKNMTSVTKVFSSACANLEY